MGMGAAPSQPPKLLADEGPSNSEEGPSRSEEVGENEWVPSNDGGFVRRSALDAQGLQRPQLPFQPSTDPGVRPAERSFVTRIPVQLQGLTTSKPQLLAVAILLVYTAIGTVGFGFALKLNALDAFYFAVTTAATVGYGDIHPHDTGSTLTLIMTMVYILTGLVLFGAALGLLVGGAIDRPLHGRSTAGTMLRIGLLILLFVAVGAACICALEGWSPLQGAYWAVVTLSTVGYGSLVPKTEGGRAFAAVFMLIGVSGTAKAFSEAAALPVDAYQDKLRRKVLDQYGESLEADELAELAGGSQAAELGISEDSTSIKRNEFCLLMLIRMGRITGDDLKLVQAAFDRLDATGDRQLDSSE